MPVYSDSDEDLEESSVDQKTFENKQKQNYSESESDEEQDDIKLKQLMSKLQKNQDKNNDLL